MATIRSPCCGYNLAWCVELKGEDLSSYTDKIESVSLRKCPHDHRLTNKAYLSAITVTSVSPTSWHTYGKKLRHCHPTYQWHDAIWQWTKLAENRLNLLQNNRKLTTNLIITRGKVLSWEYRSPRKRNSRPPASVVLCWVSWVENVLLIYYASSDLLACLHWKKSPVYGVFGQ